MTKSDLKYVLLAGGVGGAKLAVGLAGVLPPERLTIIGNTGDDFVHMGLHISPDLDTLMYSLGKVANPETGWGRVDESWRVMEAVRQFGGADWFNLGDLDLATHLTRTQWLQEGQTLTQVTQAFCRQLNIQHPLYPMSNTLAPTMIETEEMGVLPFQTWFVQERCQPTVKKVQLPEMIKASPHVAQALQKADVVIIAPSNPFLSIEPILNVYPIRAMVSDLPELVVGVSPIIAGQAVKGPLGKMLADWQMPATVHTIDTHYEELVDLFVYDVADQEAASVLSAPHHLCTQTLMRSYEDKVQLAQEIVDKVVSLFSSPG